MELTRLASKCFTCGPTSVCSALVATLCLLSRFLEAMGQNALRMLDGPTVRQQSSQHLRTRVHRKLQDHVVQYGYAHGSSQDAASPPRGSCTAPPHVVPPYRCPGTTSSFGRLPDHAAGAPTRYCRSSADRPACIDTTLTIGSTRICNRLRCSPDFGKTLTDRRSNSPLSRSKIGTASVCRSMHRASSSQRPSPGSSTS